MVKAEPLDQDEQNDTINNADTTPRRAMNQTLARLRERKNMLQRQRQIGQPNQPRIDIPGETGNDQQTPTLRIRPDSDLKNPVNKTNEQGKNDFIIFRNMLCRVLNKMVRLQRNHFC